MRRWLKKGAQTTKRVRISKTPIQKLNFLSKTLSIIKNKDAAINRLHTNPWVTLTAELWVKHIMHFIKDNSRYSQNITPLMDKGRPLQTQVRRRRNAISFSKSCVRFLDSFLSSTGISSWKSNMHVNSPVLSIDVCIWRFVRHWTQLVAY